MSIRHRRHGRRRTAWYAGFALLSAVAIIYLVFIRPRETAHTLPRTLDSLPYRFAHASPFDEARLQVRAVDLDGDGVDEVVTLSRNRRHAERFIAAAFIEESQRYSITQMNMSSTCELMGVIDVTGDDQHELIWWEQRPEGIVEFVVTGFDTIAVDSGRRQMGSIFWDATGSLMEDGVWGGSGYVVSAFDMDGNGTRETLLVGVSTGVLRTPRGLWLMDWETGTITGRRGTGATPRDGLIVDVDGDGADEIVIALESPGNGAVSEPFDDGHAYVAVFAKDLSLKWWQELAGYSARVSYAVADLDGDGALEVVTGVGGHRRELESDFALRVWSGATGKHLVSLSLGGPVNDIATFSTSEGPRICAGLADGRILRYEYADGELIQDAAFRDTEGIRLVRTMDFGIAGPEQTLLVMTVNGTVALTDEELRPLAGWRTTEAVDGKSQIVPARFSVGGEVVPGMIFQTGKHLYYTYAVRIPLSLWVVLVSIIAVALLVCAITPSIRRRLLMLLRRTLIPRADREKSLDELLGALVRAGHGKLAATTTLRRLTKQLTMLGGLESEPPAQFADRYREAIRDVREIGMPGVEAIHREAARIGLKTSLVSKLRRELGSTRSLLRRVPARPPGISESSGLADLLDERTASLDDALDGVLDGCRLELSSNLMNEIRRAAGARRSDFIELGAELTVPTVSKVEAVRVLGTRAEASFVIENLLGNSLAAVERSDEQHVDVTVEVADGEAVMFVCDTGTGIPPDMHERIFDDGVTGTHGGSGHGLAESRRILTKRGGSIAVARSKPGQGTTFEVRFQTVDGGTQ